MDDEEIDSPIGVETSIRYSGVSKAVRIHAKQRFPLPFFPDTRFQVHGELDTKNGAPSYFCAMIRRYYPNLAAIVRGGLQYDRQNKLQYTARGKLLSPMFPPIWVRIKGQYNVDKQFKEVKRKLAAEFAWDILDFTLGQDVGLRVGYDVFDKVPYLQIKENNWMVNVDIRGRWNVRYDIDIDL